MNDARAAEASARAAAAAVRAAELEERLRRLRAGDPSTAADVDRATRAAALESERSGLALERALEGHVRAAEAHHQASELFDDAGQADRAEEHRSAAAEQEQARLDALPRSEDSAS